MIRRTYTLPFRKVTILSYVLNFVILRAEAKPRLVEIKPSFVALVQPNRGTSSACRDSLRYCCSSPVIRFSPCFVALNEPTVPKSGPDLLRGGLDEADGHSRHHSHHTTRRAAGVVRQPAGERHSALLSRFLLRGVSVAAPRPSFSAAIAFPPQLLRLHNMLDLPGAHFSL